MGQGYLGPFTPCQRAGCLTSVFVGEGHEQDRDCEKHVGSDLPLKPPYVAPSGNPDYQTEAERRAGYAPGQRGWVR